MSGPHLVEPPLREWYCPACKATDTTREARPHSRMHTCPKLGMLTVPMDLVMLPVGVRAKVETREREDYIGEEDVFLDPSGRPIMALVVTRDEGQDAAVFAPTAHAHIS